MRLSGKKHSLMKDKVLPVLVILLALATIGGATAFFESIKKNDAVASLVVPTSHTVILIDQTDTLSQRCVARLESMLKNLPETIKPGETVSVFAIHANSDIAVTPLLSVRNPGRDANEWIENYRLKHEAFDKEFLEPISEVSKGLGNRPTSSASPIIETVNRIAEWHKFCDKVGHRRMVVFSDMLQNSPNCSDYSTSKVVHPASTGCPELVPLTGVEVDINYVMRRNKTAIQTAAHRERWRNLFEKAGAEVHITPTM